MNGSHTVECFGVISNANTFSKCLVLCVQGMVYEDHLDFPWVGNLTIFAWGVAFIVCVAVVVPLIFEQGSLLICIAKISPSFLHVLFKACRWWECLEPTYPLPE
ncbi:hypothetical protein L1049_013851 [Liquidambar formosana]|uniref:Uncharacterized protein n=1 Tax=Liquidambar formosana TaxID=63359 RepID=A0AAP0WUF0_LIQFO